MTISVSLGFDPIWSNFNIFGVSAGGAQLFSYDSLNPTVFKPIFSDPGMNFPYSQPILWDQNGNAPGPFYFTLDSLNPSSLYDLFLYDAQGNLIWNVNSYYPSGGSGGSVVTAIDLSNLIVNGTMWRNIGSGTGSPPTDVPITTKITMIAPGTHDALSANVAPTPISTTENSFGPDIQFIKTNTTATDIIAFPVFIPGDTPFTGDVTPVDYVDFRTTSPGTSETYKYFQFPVNAKAQTLSNQQVTIKLWAKGISGTQTISLKWAQFFGDGTAGSLTVVTDIATLNLATTTGVWTPFNVPATVPSVAGKTLGECGNDGLFLLVGMPLTTVCRLNFTKVSLYLGTIAPGAELIEYDVIDSTVNSPRTGDVRTSLNNFAPFGWVPMNDGTIGNVGSTATTRNKIDTFPLFNLLWNSVSNTYAPVLPSRGASAIADFVANKTIAITKALGRVMAGTEQVQTIETFTAASGSDVLTLSGVNTNIFKASAVRVFNLTNQTAGLIESQVYFATPDPVFNNLIRLSTTVANSYANIFIIYTGAGVNGSVASPPHILGEFFGEEKHQLSVAELASHTHPTITDISANPGIPTNVSAGLAIISGVTGPTGNDIPHNTVQLTSYLNMFMKL